MLLKCVLPLLRLTNDQDYFQLFHSIKSQKVMFISLVNIIELIHVSTCINDHYFDLFGTYPHKYIVHTLWNLLLLFPTLIHRFFLIIMKN